MGDELKKQPVTFDPNRYKTVRADLNFNHRIDSPDEHLGATEALIEYAVKAASIIDSYVANGHFSMPDVNDPSKYIDIRLKEGPDGLLNHKLIRAMAEANIRAAGYDVSTVREELVSDPFNRIEYIQSENFGKLALAHQ